MNILLVDDEHLQLLRLENAAKKVLANATFYSFTNPLEAYEESKKHSIDIAFLDIEMPVINGIQLAKKLKTINPKTNVIFVTAYDNYALQAFKVHASGYLTKPVSEEKIKVEIDNLNRVEPLNNNKDIQIKCFGNFEIFYKDEPIKFSYQKSKEVVAYLIDREGAVININELNAVLWEEDHKSYLRNLLADIQKTFKSLGISDVLVKRRNGYSIDVNQVDCDAYEYKNGNPDAIRLYRGEYMIQYPWAFFKE